MPCQLVSCLSNNLNCSSNILYHHQEKLFILYWIACLVDPKLQFDNIVLVNAYNTNYVTTNRTRKLIKQNIELRHHDCRYTILFLRNISQRLLYYNTGLSLELSIFHVQQAKPSSNASCYKSEICIWIFYRACLAAERVQSRKTSWRFNKQRLRLKSFKIFATLSLGALVQSVPISDVVISAFCHSGRLLAPPRWRCHPRRWQCCGDENRVHSCNSWFASLGQGHDHSLS